MASAHRWRGRGTPCTACLPGPVTRVEHGPVRGSDVCKGPDERGRRAEVQERIRRVWGMGKRMQAGPSYVPSSVSRRRLRTAVIRTSGPKMPTFVRQIRDIGARPQRRGILRARRRRWWPTVQPRAVRTV